MAVNLTFTFLDWAAYINNKYDGTDEDRENFIQQIESDFPANEEHNTFDIMQYMYDVDNTLALATNQSSNSDHPTPNLRQNQNTPSPINTIPSRPHNSYSNSSNHNNHSNNNPNLRQNQNTPSPINTIPSRPHNSYSNSSNHNNHSNNN
eukprot:294994_1